jgi:hypothetical protein
MHVTRSTFPVSSHWSILSRSLDVQARHSSVTVQNGPPSAAAFDDDAAAVAEATGASDKATGAARRIAASFPERRRTDGILAS